MDLYLYSSDGYLGLVILLCFVRGVQLPADRGYVSSSVFVFVCVLDRFCCGAAFILISIAQPSRRFVRVKSMSPWRGAGVLAQRS